MCFNFTRNIYLFLQIWMLQATWSIYYFRRSGDTNLSLHSYHMTDPNDSKKISSFQYYQGVDYQAVPIWDCKVALIPENSNTKNVVTFNMLSSEVKLEHTLLQSRNGFAALMVGLKLYVCGGLESVTNACEVWSKGKKEFIDSGHKWLTLNSSGPRRGFTLHQFDKWLCAFGGSKYNDGGLGTKTVSCFDTKGNITIDLANDCSQDSFRANHASILYDGNTVIICGGVTAIREKLCDVLQISGLRKVCLGKTHFHRWQERHSNLLMWGEDVLALGAIINVIPANDDNWQTAVSMPVVGLSSLFWRKPSRLKHNVSDIRLFNIFTTCSQLASSRQKASTTVKTISGCACQSCSCSASLTPYQVALVCAGCVCTILLGFLVYVARRGHYSVDRNQDAPAVHAVISRNVQKRRSSAMLDHKMSTSKELDSVNLIPGFSNASLCTGMSMTVHAISKTGSASTSKDALHFPEVSKSRDTHDVELIGSSDVSSGTTILTPKRTSLFQLVNFRSRYSSSRSCVKAPKAQANRSM